MDSKPLSERCVSRPNEADPRQVRAGQITFSSLSFDTHDLIRQLAAVDDAQLMACLERIRQLDDLAGVHGDAERRQDVLDRLGRELDAARNVVRPYFRR